MTRDWLTDIFYFIFFSFALGINFAKCVAGVEETPLQKQESDSGYSDYPYFIVLVGNRVRRTRCATGDLAHISTLSN